VRIVVHAVHCAFQCACDVHGWRVRLRLRHRLSPLRLDVCAR
jgi:hypothetical protein